MKPSSGTGSKVHRTPRTRALEVGTDPSGFPDNADGEYDPQAGTPREVAGGAYKPNVDGGGATPAAPSPNPSPFKLGPQ